MNEALEAIGKRSFWSPPEDATPEQIAEFEAFAAKMLVPDETITTWVDVSGALLEAKWKAIHEHRTQIADERRSCSSASTAGASWGRGGVHPARVAGPERAARDGPLRRPRLIRSSAAYQGRSPFDAS